MKPLQQRFDEILAKAMKERGDRQEFIPDPHDTHQNPAWVLFERQTMHDTVNAERQARGLQPIPISAVVRVERCASGHVDYQRKFALYCAELVLGEWRGA
jgi:hypothetical protein